MGEPKRAAVTTEHPVLLAISRSSVVPWTADELAAVEEAQREDGALIPQAAFERRLRERADVTVGEWSEAGDATDDAG